MTKPRYERPTLVRHVSGMMNKFGRVQAMQPRSHIDGVAIDELVAAYGSPLFVFSERTLVARYRELRDAFTLRYPKVRIAWSYKTNYLDGVVKVLKREGAWAEVVSAFEYDKARRMGYAPNQIHFNGPYKTREVLEEALAGGALIHIDHFDELVTLEELAAALDETPRVAIRINLAAEGVPPWTRFGFNLENGQAHDAVRRILARGVLELSGLHCHMGTFIPEPKPYEQAATKLAEFANMLRERYDITLDFIDLGGGFASHNTLKAQYLPGEQSTPSFARYAEALVAGLNRLKYPPAQMPTLVMEHGRALVDDAGHLVATVHANKRLPDGRRAVILDAGVNVLFTSFWYKHDVMPAQPFRGTPEPTVLYGPLCMNIDVMRETMLFPPVQIGDRLVFSNVGAYNVTQWMQFITTRPAVVMISADGKKHALLRRAERLDDVTAPEEIPEWI